MFSSRWCSALRLRQHTRIPRTPSRHVPHSPRAGHHEKYRNYSSEASSSTPTPSIPQLRKLKNPWLVVVPTSMLILGGAGVLAYNYNQPFRHTALAVVRCSRIAEAAVLGAVDYKMTFVKTYPSEEGRAVAVSECHTRSAQRVLRALLANGGIFIKLGQHMASIAVLPREWTSTMRPLQDQCEPTPYAALDEMFTHDIGVPIHEYFAEFDERPIGVASLAQVHVGRLRGSGERVAVKMQHPHLEEFCEIDMEMVEVSLGWIKHIFPDFEFTWLGEEMRENLPKEMDFVHEKLNAERAVADFENVRTSMHIPKVIEAQKRILVMEYIQGGRVDDLVYLSENNIDRNKVALELARIFSQMVHINGWFHAVSPQPWNLLIRPAPPGSGSPYNFEIVLLDHGLYFDLDPALRINYSKWWLALIASASPETLADRRKYAMLVGNIDEELYAVFEAAITGRAALEGAFGDDDDSEGSFRRGGSIVDLSAQTEEEMEAIRNAVVQREGLLMSVFDVLRRVPRRVLMVLKLNDLTRSLDRALATTHSNIRIFLITAKYCTFAVWVDESQRLVSEIKHKGLSAMSLGLLWDYFWVWWRYERMYRSIEFAEWMIDTGARLVTAKAWMRGLFTVGGLQGAHQAAAGLA
ncbi:ABC1-domain-containing protein [Epithele typhae]|uniref:ABC1-domain-containing protein n=1 Tax=Epithele typhae TaxID=378194 RepID=UPI002007908F|nr:ABC1-domain-containing protein [Epithele typhae]KAH9917881.1 ABC1-domain-containing protein [Epithele typhae]